MPHAYVGGVDRVRQGPKGGAMVTWVLVQEPSGLVRRAIEVVEVRWVGQSAEVDTRWVCPLIPPGQGTDFDGEEPPARS